MMLYVFHVDVGRMINFDMTVAVSSVANLKETIERLHGIPASNIVLLVSGGDELKESKQVAYLSAGTDTNPIYMFLKGEARLQPPVAQPIPPEIDLTEQVELSLKLKPVFSTVESRAQLALHMYKLAVDEESLCERLVHEQHLQQQGWSAVVANLDDLAKEAKVRFEKFCAEFEMRLEKRTEYLTLLENFSNDLKKLERIPILPGLMPLAEEDFHGFDRFLDQVSGEQQEDSELMVVGPSATSADQQGEGDNADGDGAAATTSSEDKSSTSPNKKLKMGNESLEEAAKTSTAGTSAISNLQSSSTRSSRRRDLNLLQWITSKESHKKLTNMGDECAQALHTFTRDVYEKMRLGVQKMIIMAEQTDVREIKGLSERLYRLDEFKYTIKAKVQDQKELSAAFKQNQNRAINLRDDSILPDLCASHQSQLKVMLQNHQKICELRRCILNSKDELCNNLHLRLNRIIWIQSNMSDHDNQMLFYLSCLRRAERHIQIIEQIHRAPRIYVAAVTEVVRRKIFSGEFSQWASKLAGDFDVIHNEEIKRRILFNASFEGHFLNILFPGMNDMPPAFANETPLSFDARLPNITQSDIDILSSYLPDLTSEIQLPDMEHVINFFVSHSGPYQKERMEELLRQQLTRALETGSVGEKLLHPRLSGLLKEGGTGCDESETDTETEFEKVTAGQATTTVATSTSENQTEIVSRSTSTSALLTQSAATITEETDMVTRAEVMRLQEILAALYNVSKECIRTSREDLSNFKTDVTSNCEDMQSELQLLNDKWGVARMQYEDREQKLALMSADYEHEIDVLRTEIQQRDNDMDRLREQVVHVSELELKCCALQEEVQDLNDKLKAAESEKEKAVATVREDLIHEHKNEIESLRCRYKLMTSMELSPSETSLEKIERPASSADYNMIERSEHEAVLAQMRTSFQAEKEQAISAAVENERAMWQSKVNINSESLMANVNMVKEMLADREQQLNLLREHDLMLTKENYQLKTRIDALTNQEGTSWLREKIEYLNRDKMRLEEELNMFKSRRSDMEASLKGSLHESSTLTALPRSKSSGSSHRCAALESCSKGDIVFVVWSVRHGQFMVVQDSPSLFFVHGDSLAALNLSLPSPPAATEGTIAAEELPIPIPFSAIGRVIDKEYCQARKDENRYRVTRGSKFYRIKLAPVMTKQQMGRRERIDTFSSSISRSISTCESTHSEASSAASNVPGTNVVATTSTNIAAAMLRQMHLMRTSAIGIAQTDPPMDTIDAAGATAPPAALSASVSSVATSTSSSPRGLTTTSMIKERTVSICSVTEEDDEPLNERCRYISASEEGAKPLVDTSNQQPTLQQSVITEQPTATGKLELDLMLAATDIKEEQLTLQQAQSLTSSDPMETTLTASLPTHSHSAAIPIITGAVDEDAISTGGGEEGCSPTHAKSAPATSFGTTSEDSDEYRSLEAKDDTDFTISE